MSSEWPDDALLALKPDFRTAVVTLTHDPKLDDPALIAALRSDAFYIGALGSRKTHSSRLERLRAEGFDDAALARIHGPAGLAIGAKSPAEIASWGYFIVADGTPGGDNACQGRQNGAAFLDYITWAIAENDKPCSAYYQSLDTTKIAADGFSCGGLMAENVAGDPRFTAIGITSSGLMGPNNALWDSMHAPFKIMNGGSSDIAYQNGLNDYEAISSRGIPILYFAKSSAGHGGDLNQGRGDFNLVNLAWLNWQLKGDEGATGKAFLIGDSCEFCNDGGWEFKSANID